MFTWKCDPLQAGRTQWVKKVHQLLGFYITLWMLLHSSSSFTSAQNHNQRKMVNAKVNKSFNFLHQSFFFVCVNRNAVMNFCFHSFTSTRLSEEHFPPKRMNILRFIAWSFGQPTRFVPNPSSGKFLIYASTNFNIINLLEWLIIVFLIMLIVLGIS